ncbi:MAG: heavy metal translocating P-type ATPase [Candidatus Parabeggiatoa sp. nov. 3]|nr:MAG: heavy metal translocating P-type ATPase [Gammaproteobacteria bacterium]RKZ68415.1 MAG: heavy metal translocating P-type ATPase [Gammaproteobacteria bacterium]RKZ80684.1 MAG: heavy metal translocating P-type ATPase [Gammaproteobacteria bacterium]
MIIEMLLIAGTFIGMKKIKKDGQQRMLKQAKSSLPGLFTKNHKKTTLQILKKTVLIPLTGGEVRAEQLKQMTTGKEEHGLNVYQKVKDDFRFSIGLVGLSLMGAWWYPPLQLLSAAGVFYFFWPIFQNVFQDLKKKHITTNLLDSIIITALLMMGYFFVATLFTLTALWTLKLRQQTENNSRQQLTTVFGQQPQSLWLMRDGIEVEVLLETVQKGDIVVVNAGEHIPVDGIITEGLATVDQHALTGESQPLEKEVGEKVFAATLVLAGRLFIRVENAGQETITAKIGHILQNTQDFKESLRLRGQQVADSFVGPTLVTSGLFIPLLGPTAALTVLFSALGYNMKLFGPMSVLNFLHIMAKNGILIKDGRSLEMLQQVDTLVFDKTGTLTLEQPQVCHLYPIAPLNEETLLIYAAAAEYRQKHPIAKAIIVEAEQRGLTIPTIDEAAYQVGYGIQVKLGKTVVRVGSARFMQQENIGLPKEVENIQAQCDADGHSLVYVALDEQLGGVLELQPAVRPEAKKIIKYLKEKGISLYIISGDHEQPTRQLAGELGIEHYFAETLPEQKADLIAELRAKGKFVCFVGDGINDAIALKQANVSISLRGASTAATDTAQIILMDGQLNKLKPLFEIAQAFESNMHTNYWLAIIPGTICLGGLFFFHLTVIGGMATYYTGKMVGLGNTMLPLLEYAENDEVQHSSTQQHL